MPDRIIVEIVYASPDWQRLETVSLPAESTLGEALSACGILADMPLSEQQKLRFGIWGEVLNRDHRLKNGDRIEAYRPLLIEPKEARRKLAEVGLTMRDKQAD